MTNTIQSLNLDIEGDFATDGVVCVRGLVKDDLATFREMFEEALEHPGPLAKRHYPEDASLHLTDIFNTSRWPAFRRAFDGSRVPDAVATVLGCHRLWFFFEQVFLKTGGETRRTPWHQDASYVPITGHHQAVVWIPLAPVSQESALEFVRGSHAGPIYQISNFDPDDDTAPDRTAPDRPRLPDIEADRGSYDIVSWGLDAGDVLIFHLATLHGGAATSAGSERRTVSLRYFGPDAWFEPLEGVAYGAQARDGNAPVTANPMAEMFAELAPGDPFSAGSWPLVRSNSRGA
jgi:ectoine hydroxylase-related dioxygenase (phytanoyl-CoA dioxygenase family)